MHIRADPARSVILRRSRRICGCLSSSPPLCQRFARNASLAIGRHIITKLRFMQAPATINATFAQGRMIYISLPMAKRTSEGKSLIPPATVPAGRNPRTAYCTPQCYEKGILARAGSCQCKKCHGHAHAQGRKFDHGYLKNSPPDFRRPPLDQEWLFPEEPPTPIEDACHP